jgi:ornithine carbamoyltransferase
VERARNEAVSRIEISNNTIETVKGAHVVYVDVLASLGRKKRLPCIHSTSRDFRSLLHDMPLLLKSLEAL